MGKTKHISIVTVVLVVSISCSSNCG